MGRGPWEKPYVIEKKAYAENVKAYEDSGKKDQWKVQADFLKRDPEKPKRPLTPWLVYLGEYRAKNQKPDSKVTMVTKSAAQIWRTMTDQQKAPYNKTYEEAKGEYAKSMEAYKASGKEEVWKEKTADIMKNHKVKKVAKDAKSKGATKKLSTKKSTASMSE